MVAERRGKKERKRAVRGEVRRQMGEKVDEMQYWNADIVDNCKINEYINKIIFITLCFLFQNNEFRKPSLGDQKDKYCSSSFPVV